MPICLSVYFCLSHFIYFSQSLPLSHSVYLFVMFSSLPLYMFIYVYLSVYISTSLSRPLTVRTPCISLPILSRTVYLYRSPTPFISFSHYFSYSLIIYAYLSLCIFRYLPFLLYFSLSFPLSHSISHSVFLSPSLFIYVYLFLSIFLNRSFSLYFYISK